MFKEKHLKLAAHAFNALLHVSSGAYNDDGKYIGQTTRIPLWPCEKQVKSTNIQVPVFERNEFEWTQNGEEKNGALLHAVPVTPTRNTFSVR